MLLTEGGVERVYILDIELEGSNIPRVHNTSLWNSGMIVFCFKISVFRRKYFVSYNVIILFGFLNIVQQLSCVWAHIIHFDEDIKML